jgi:hypothetical protein
MSLQTAPVSFTQGPVSWRPNRRTWRLTGGVVLVLVVLALFWVGVRTAQAQHAMSHASDRFTLLQQHLRAGDTNAVAADVAAIKKDTGHARGRAKGVTFDVVSAVPFFGRTPRTTKALAVAADDLARGPLQQIVQAKAAASVTALRGRDGTFDLGAVAAAGGSADALARIGHELAGIRTRVAHTSHGAFVLDPVERARSSTLQSLDSVQASVSVATQFARLAPSMIGSSTTHRYLVVVQNNNRARGTGGVPEAWATVEARLGQLRVSDINLITGLSNASRWPSANADPDFPAVARQWARLWAQAKPTTHIDGVVGLDPLGLRDITAATGPLVVEGRTAATAASIPRLVEVQYAGAHKPRLRDVLLPAVTKTVLTDAFVGKGDSQALIGQLAGAAATGHARIWSAHAAEQSVLTTTAFGGALPSSSVPFAEAVVNNTSGARLDYFLQRSVSYFAGSCRTTSRESTVVVRLTNLAPTKPPSFLTEHTDHPPRGTPGTQLRMSLAVYASAGSRLQSATLDDRPVTMKQRTEHGRPVFVTDVTINRLTTRTLSLQLVEPRLRGAAVVPEQPLAQPQRTEVQAAVCR